MEMNRRLHRPALNETLKLLRLDYTLHSARSQYVYTDAKQTNESRILDLIAGYGSCLLGHNNKLMTKVVRDHFKRSGLSHAQLSFRRTAGELAEKISEIALEETNKKYIITFMNTGSEAVEAALKHAFMQYERKKSALFEQIKRICNVYNMSHRKNEISLSSVTERLQHQFSDHAPVFIALKGSYHGNTLGALSLTAGESHKIHFGKSAFDCIFIDERNENDQTAEIRAFDIEVPELQSDGNLTYKKMKWYPFIALIAEPIRGEGGVKPLQPEQAGSLAALAKRLKIPFIWDEIQSGCYRTGRLFASTELHVTADYYLLGKALGGGIGKISALLISEDNYIHEFGLIHNSTFAEDEFTSAISLEFIAVAQNSVKDIENKSLRWETMLTKLSTENSDVIKEVRGKGLIRAVEFNNFYYSDSYLFQSVSRGGYFNYIVIAWLYHHHKIRFSAPLSGTHTIRLHPPLSCTTNDIKKVFTALKDLCHVLRCADFYMFISFLLPEELQCRRTSPEYFTNGIIHHGIRSDQIGKACFLTHFVNTETITETDHSIAGIEEQQLESVLYNFKKFLAPVIMGEKIISTTQNTPVHLTVIGLPFTSNMIREAMKNQHLSEYSEMVVRAMKLGETECSPDVLGLGQFTSVITSNGLTLAPDKAVITTGNGFTAYAAVSSVLKCCLKNNIKLTEESVAVYGAAGNIGRMIVQLLTGHCRKIILFDNPLNVKKNILEKLIQKNFRGSKTKIKIADAQNSLEKCAIVICAASASAPFIRNDMLRSRAVICDISIPPSICRDVIKDSCKIISDGGIVQLPGGGIIPGKGHSLPEGSVYACLAETLTLAATKQYFLRSYGELEAETVISLGELAEKSGFTQYINPKQHV